MKLTTRSMALVGTALLSISLLFNACQKDDISNPNDNVPPGSSRFAVYLTDGPYDFQQVLVDIQQIAVKLDTCHRNHDDDHNYPGCDDDHDQYNSNCEIWDTLDIRPGVYDLLKLRNGVDTLLASGFVLNGKVLRIKFTLGDNNSLMADSVIHPIKLVNNQHFVYVDIKKQHLDSLSSNNFQLYLDFDLARSIKYYNGQYWMKPVLKPFGHHSTGEIEGKVRPPHSYGSIRVINGTDTSFARPENEGRFKIRGLREGTYSLWIEGRNGYLDSTINNITVQRARETDIGTIQLHK